MIQFSQNPLTNPSDLGITYNPSDPNSYIEYNQALFQNDHFYGGNNPSKYRDYSIYSGNTSNVNYTDFDNSGDIPNITYN